MAAEARAKVGEANAMAEAAEAAVYLELPTLADIVAAHAAVRRLQALPPIPDCRWRGANGDHGASVCGNCPECLASKARKGHETKALKERARLLDLLL